MIFTHAELYIECVHSYMNATLTFQTANIATFRAP